MLCKRLGKRAGIQFNALGTEFRSETDVGVTDIHEDADACPKGMKGSNQRAQALAITAKIKAMVGGQLAVTIRHQRDLRWPNGFAQGQQAGVAGSGRCERVPLDVEFDAVLVAQRCQHVDIVFANVSGIRPGVHGEAVGPGVQANGGGAEDIGRIAAS